MTAIWLTTTIGFVLCLGLVGGMIFHFLGRALDSEDAVRIDKLNSEEEELFFPTEDEP
ncbi:hypothetical protein [Neobacillus vireti]|uniref:hypothetical protein n=1 Tax=Neobacillus vireti TaxID=220686 RepID=UPI0003FFB870|nr:hypothetical protein [Neobacillus vireti]